MKFKWEDSPAFDVQFKHEEIEVNHEGKVSKRPACTATFMVWDKMLGWRECFSDMVVQYHKDRQSKILAEKYAFLKLFRNLTHPWTKHVPYCWPETLEDQEVGLSKAQFWQFKKLAFNAFFTPKRRRMISAEGRRKK